MEQTRGKTPHELRGSGADDRRENRQEQPQVSEFEQKRELKSEREV